MLGKDWVTVIIAAAGESARMGLENSKQFIKIGNRMVLERTLDTFDKVAAVDDIILVIRECDIDFLKKEILMKNQYRKPIQLIIGGKSRQESTLNGIKAAPSQTSILICHDGARPFIMLETINQALEQLAEYDAVVVGVPAKDTIKMVRDNMVVLTTPLRSSLFQVQTPQIFRKDLLFKAYLFAGEEFINTTDDAALLEIMGERVKIVIGEYSNIKITTKEDVALGEIFLQYGLLK